MSAPTYEYFKNYFIVFFWFFTICALQARGGIEQDVLEAYCWMYSTWNIPKEYKGACSGGDQVRK